MFKHNPFKFIKLSLALLSPQHTAKKNQHVDSDKIETESTLLKKFTNLRDEWLAHS